VENVATLPSVLLAEKINKERKMRRKEEEEAAKRQKNLVEGEEEDENLTCKKNNNNSLPSEDDITKAGKFTTWRNTSKSSTSMITEDMLLYSEYYESFFQCFRKKKLRKIFGKDAFINEVLYCDQGPHSQQNRCITAFKKNKEENTDLLVEKVGNTDTHALVDSLVARIKSVAALYGPKLLPIDLRPRGLVSTRYNFDGRTRSMSMDIDRDNMNMNMDEPTVFGTEMEDFKSGANRLASLQLSNLEKKEILNRIEGLI